MSDEYFTSNDSKEEAFEELSVDELIASAKADLNGSDTLPTDPFYKTDFITEQINDATQVFPQDIFPAFEEQFDNNPVNLPDGPDTDFDTTRKVASFDPVTGMPLLGADDVSNVSTEPVPAAYQETPNIQDDFEPDFGSAFDDYGDYSEPESDTPEIVPEMPPKKVKSKRRRIPTFVRVLLYFAITIAFGIGLGLFGWECAQDVLALGQHDKEITVSIRVEDNIDDITDKLYDNGLIRHKWLFKIYCDVTDADKKIDPGVYKLNYQYDYHALVNGMIKYAPTRATVTVMITEGYDCEQLFALLEENGVCKAEELRNTAKSGDFDYWFLDEVPVGTENRLEGFLYPDTYEFYISDDAENVLKKMLNNFEKKISEFEDEIKQSGFTVRDIINIAAMIEEEAANNEERATISSVIHNRLKTDNYLQYLQMDSTVFYACQLEGISFDVTIDSPYNTYAYPGLPYGPVSNPGLYSIKAALRPQSTDYYYFAAGKDGVSHFFTDYDAFNAFVTSDQYIGYFEKND